MLIQRPGANDREVALRKYFTRPTKPSESGVITLIALGCTFFGLGVLILLPNLFSLVFGRENFNSAATQFSLLLLVAGVGLAGAGAASLRSIRISYQQLLSSLSPQPSDLEVDAWFADDIEKLIDHARNSLHMPEATTLSRPLAILAPSLNPLIHGIPLEEIAFQFGKDKRARFSIHHALIIFLTEHHLVAFSCDFNLIRSVALNETTHEYHYCDIISVSTLEESEARTLPTGEKLATSQTFFVSVASGESLKVSVDIARLRQMASLVGAPETGADAAVRAIRAMLREKKG